MLRNMTYTHCPYAWVQTVCHSEIGFKLLFRVSVAVLCILGIRRASNLYPQGSVLFNYFNHGKLQRSDGSSITEG